MDKVPRISGLALIIGFFLPFISMGPISCSGLDLVKMGGGGGPAGEMLGGLGDMGGDSASEESSGGPSGWQLQIIALIPIAGLVSVIANKKLVYFICGAVPTLMFAVHMVQTEGGLIKMMGVGAWLCTVGGIVMLSTASRLPSAALASEDGGGGLDPGGDADGDGGA